MKFPIYLYGFRRLWSIDVIYGVVKCRMINLSAINNIIKVLTDVREKSFENNNCSITTNKIFHFVFRFKGSFLFHCIFL